MLTWFVFQDWFEKYHDRVLEAELLLLTTLNFELNVQHPYAPLTSILDKLGPSKTILVNLALNLISKGWVFIFVGSYTSCNRSSMFACLLILWTKYVLLLMSYLCPSPQSNSNVIYLSGKHLKLVHAYSLFPPGKIPLISRTGSLYDDYHISQKELIWAFPCPILVLPHHQLEQSHDIPSISPSIFLPVVVTAFVVSLAQENTFLYRRVEVQLTKRQQVFGAIIDDTWADWWGIQILLLAL